MFYGESEIFDLKQESFPDTDCEIPEELLDNEDLKQIPTIKHTKEKCDKRSPFNGLATLITIVKNYDYISLMESAYAPVGNKPFKLKKTKDADISDEVKKEASIDFYEFIQSFIDQNEIKIDEIPIAFNSTSLTELSKELSTSAKKIADQKVEESLIKCENIIEKTFKDTRFMRQYLEAGKDTTVYPLGVIWIDEAVMATTKKIKNGKLKYLKEVVSKAKRIDPCYFWATPDWEINKSGRAFFRLVEKTKGDLMRCLDKDVSGSEYISNNLKYKLEHIGDYHREYRAMLFRDSFNLSEGYYDVIISRGFYNREYIESTGVTIDEKFNGDTIIPAEIWKLDNAVIKVKVLNTADERLGVYTSSFRRFGNSIYGLSLKEFIHPFAEMYEGAVKAVDRDVGKTASSIIQIDTSVIENPEEYFKTDKETGAIVLDLSSDLMMPFDSSLSTQMLSPNFKGVPVTVDQFKGNLSSLIPVVSFVFEQMEKISGIPNILVNTDNISSALRTTESLNAAFHASSKGVQALLRDMETLVLMPCIQMTYDIKAYNGDMADFLSVADPEILLSDALNRDNNDNMKLLEGIQVMGQTGLVPPEKLAGVLNIVGRKLYGFSEDIIPNIAPVSVAGTTEAPSVN